jgi:peptide/nickel transport system ATP-binding protein
MAEPWSPAPTGAVDIDLSSTRAPLLDISHLSVTFPGRRSMIRGRLTPDVRAVVDATLQVGEGETVGLVGESGSGKTTIGKAILRFVPASGGTIRLGEHDVTGFGRKVPKPYRREVQVVFQDPVASLNPSIIVGDLIGEPLKLHFAMGTEARRRRAIELLEQVGLAAHHLERYPYEFSGGQRQRIAVARALASEPRLIVLDEPVSALDVSTQSQVINLLEKLQSETGVAYLLIAHDLAVVRHVSDEVAVMYLGGIVEQAASDDLYAGPLHPYTKALMSAVPVPDPVVEASRERILLQGDLPSPADPPAGCRFHTRCPFRQETRCDTERPALRELAPGHRVACHFAEEIAAGTLTPHEVSAEEAAAG